MSTCSNGITAAHCWSRRPTRSRPPRRASMPRASKLRRGPPAVEKAMFPSAQVPLQHQGPGLEVEPQVDVLEEGVVHPHGELERRGWRGGRALWAEGGGGPSRRGGQRG